MTQKHIPSTHRLEVVDGDADDHVRDNERAKGNERAEVNKSGNVEAFVSSLHRKE
jgi:hypothetical protein